MEPLSMITATLTLTVASLMLPRIMMDWWKFQQLCQEKDRERLLEMLAMEKEWVNRHFVCGFVSIMMIAILKTNQGLAGFAGLAEVIAVYTFLAFLLTFIESLFAQRVARELVTLETAAARKTAA